MADRKGIEILFKTHYDRMLRLAGLLLHDWEAATDVVHDVFESLLNIKDCQSITETYLLSAVRNRSLNLIRDKEIHQRILHLHFSNDSEYEAEDWPDESALREIYKTIEEELTPMSRRVMGMRFREGMTFSRIAEEIGVSETAVYRQVRQALMIIRKNLRNNGQI